MAHLLGIDIGTSGTKTLICDQKTEKCWPPRWPSIPSLRPSPAGRSRIPQDWWQAACKATKAVLKKAKVKPADITAIGLSGQMHGSVFLGDGPKPLRPALLWNDQRTAEQCWQIEAQSRRARGADRTRRQSRAHRLHRAEDPLGARA